MRYKARVQPRPASAALVLAGASLVLAVMAVLAKQASTRLPAAEVAFIRFLFGLTACSAAGFLRGLHANNKRGLVLRGILGGSAVFGYFLAIEHLPVGLATLLNYTAPVFTAIWAAIFLSERLDRVTVSALFVATAGVALVSGASWGFSRWVLVGALSAIISGAAVATIREVRKTDGSWEIFTAFCAGGALITGVPAVYGWVPPSALEWWLLAAVGITAVIGQLGLTPRRRASCNSSRRWARWCWARWCTAIGSRRSPRWARRSPSPRSVSAPGTWPAPARPYRPKMRDLTVALEWQRCRDGPFRF